MSIFSIFKPKVKVKQEFDFNKIKYPCIVKSSAGTGKTETIANIVINILKQEPIDISNIAIITFTNKAANEMQDRIQSKLEKLKDKNLKNNLYLCNSANISTIHTFCERIIRQYGLKLGIGTSFIIKNNKQAVSTIVGQIIKENFNNEFHQSISNYKLKELIIKSLEDNENKGIEHLEENTELRDEFWIAFDKYFVDLYNKCFDAIVQDKLKNNYLTPNDLIKYAAHLVKDSNIARQIAKEIKYLFVDEFQDTNLQQYMLVKHLKDYINILVVGDKKQSIYKFRGADLDSYLQMENDIVACGEGHTFSSNINYRSDHNYVEQINKLFNKNFNFNGISLNFEKNFSIAYNKENLGNKRPIAIDQSRNLEEIIKKMALKLEYGKNPCYNGIVVLCRNNKEVPEIEYLLNNADIPNVTISGNSLFQEQVVIDTIKILEYLIFGDELYKEEICQTIHFMKFSKVENSKKQFIKEIESLKDCLKDTSIANIIDLIVEKSKISSAETRIHDRIGKLKMFARQFTDYVEFYNASLQKIDNNEIAFETDENAVLISTIHKFKGLTANHVILYNADNNLMNFKHPQFIISNSKIYFNDSILDSRANHLPDKCYQVKYRQYIKDYLEEELRVLYVALTRARHTTIMTCKHSDEKRSWLKDKTNYTSYITLLNF